ncbi:uncharacterized [Tachysurus ichikawai]
MSMFEPPAWILLSMFVCSACSWLYVLPLNTDCTSLVPVVLIPSRRQLYHTASDANKSAEDAIARRAKEGMGVMRTSSASRCL